MNENKTIEFGTTKASPGKKGTGYIRVGDLCDGSPIQMPVIILNGSKPGPKLLMIGLEDGDEYQSTLGALDAANNYLEKNLNQMSGSVVILPTNIGAFRGNPFGGGQRNSPLDLDQGLRLGKLYPGNPNGRHSDQLAYQIDLAKKQYDADFLIRLHGCKQIHGWPRVIIPKNEAGSKMDGMARAAITKQDDMFILLGLGEAGGAAAERQVEIMLDMIGPEFNGITNADRTRECVLNVMKFLKMIPGEAVKVDKVQYLMRKSVKTPDGGTISSGAIYSKRGGFLKPAVKAKDRVKEGQVIGRILNFFGEVVEELKSPIDGVIVGIYGESPHIGSGQWRLFEIAYEVDHR